MKNLRTDNLSSLRRPRYNMVRSKGIVLENRPTWHFVKLVWTLDSESEVSEIVCLWHVFQARSSDSLYPVITGTANASTLGV